MQLKAPQELVGDAAVWLLSSQDPLGSGTDPAYWGFGVPFEPHVASGCHKPAWCRGHNAAPLSRLSWLTGVQGGSLHP